jgi:hypothetical protein
MTHRTSLAWIVTFVLLATAATACGGGNVGEQSEPEAALGDEIDTNILRINAPDRLNDQSNTFGFNVRSTGEAPLKITDLSLEPSGDIPSRLLYNGEETETSCEFNSMVSETNDASGNCSSNQYCNAVTGQCHETGLPETPITVDNSQSFEFLLAASSEAEMVCPDPPDERPEKFVGSTATWNQITAGGEYDYCGELHIETNARNSGSVFNNGNARVYLMTNTGSGQITLNPENFSFEDIQPGTTKEQTLTILNDGRGPLRVDNINVVSNARFVSVEPTDSSNSYPVEIPGSNSDSGAGDATWTVTVSIPEGTDPDEIPSNSSLKVISSAANAPDSGTSVGISISTPSAGPAIDFVDGNKKPKTALSFESSQTQTIGVRNQGTEDSLLVLRSIGIELFQNCPGSNQGSCDPESRRQALADAYSMTLGGQSVSLGTSPTNLGAGNVGDKRTIRTDADPQSLKVTYDGGSGDAPPLGYLVVNHNDSTSGGSARIALLGARSGALVETLPGSVTFKHGDSEQTRTILLRNQGTSPIEMKPPSDEDLTGAFDVVNPSGSNDSWTVPAEGLKPITVKFFGTNDSNELTVGDIAFQSTEEAVQDEITFDASTRQDFFDFEASIANQNRQLRVGSALRFSASTMPQLQATYQWVVLKRPAESRIFRARPTTFSSDNTFQIQPGQPGTYRIGVTVRAAEVGKNGQIQAMKSYDVKAEGSSNGNGNGGDGGN